jgi:putative transcriptional regulator
MVYTCRMAETRPRLAQARKAAGLTQTALAEAVGIHQPLVARYEAGFTEPRVTMAVRIARALETTVEALWPLDDKEARAQAA